jgi:hypothetical protein
MEFTALTHADVRTLKQRQNEIIKQRVAGLAGLELTR